MGKSVEANESTSKRTSRPKRTRKKNELKRTTINDESEVITNDQCSDLPVWNSNFLKNFLQWISPAQIIQKNIRFAAILQRFHAEIDFFLFCVGVCVGKIKSGHLRVWIYIEDSICFREIFFLSPTPDRFFHFVFIFLFITYYRWLGFCQNNTYSTVLCVEW